MNKFITYEGTFQGVRYKIYEDIPPCVYRWSAAIFLSWGQFKERQERDVFFFEGELVKTAPDIQRYFFPVPQPLRGMPHGPDTYGIQADYKGPPSHGGAVIGWDYGHLWDEGRYYDFTSVLHDVQRNIMWLHGNYRIMSMCDYCGVYGEAHLEGWVQPAWGKWDLIHAHCFDKLCKSIREGTPGFDPWDSKTWPSYLSEVAHEIQ